MANGNDDLVELAMEATLKWATKSFAKDRDRERLVADAVSEAWIWAQRTDNPNATPSTIARFAVRRVKSNRQMPESVRSITSLLSARGWKAKPRREPMPWQCAARATDDPAELAQVRIDFAEFLKRLNNRDRKLCLDMVAGGTNSELRAKYHISNARVSQLRRQFVEDFLLFCS